MLTTEPIEQYQAAMQSLLDRTTANTEIDPHALLGLETDGRSHARRGDLDQSGTGTGLDVGSAMSGEDSVLVLAEDLPVVKKAKSEWDRRMELENECR
jgi:hypothetical protein